MAEVVVLGREKINASPSAIPPLFQRVVAPSYLYQKGTQTDGHTVGSFDDGDYLVYGLCNFGPRESTNAIRFRYAKGPDGGCCGSVEVRLDGHDGRLIGTFVASDTGGWNNYIVASLDIDDVHGVHSVTLVARKIQGV